MPRKPGPAIRSRGTPQRPKPCPRRCPVKRPCSSARPGAPALALALGPLTGTAPPVARAPRRLSAPILGVTPHAAAVPAFFVAYFLQTVVIMLGASTTTRAQLLPVYGFGCDGHLVLPLL